MADDSAVQKLGLVHEIPAGDKINHANSTLAQAHDSSIVSKSLVGQARARLSLVDSLDAEVLCPLAATPAPSVEGVMESVMAMRAELQALRADVNALRVDVGALRADVGAPSEDSRTLPVVASLRQEIHNINNKVFLANLRTTNFTIRQLNWDRIRKAEDLIPLHKVVPGSGLEIAQALLPHTGVDMAALRDLDTGAQIGATPKPFYPMAMDHKEILEMIVFYNDDVGIKEDMDLGTRQRVLLRYLLNPECDLTTPVDKIMCG